MISGQWVYVGMNITWVLFGAFVTLLVVNFVVGIAITVLEKMTERKKAELEELQKELREKALRNE